MIRQEEKAVSDIMFCGLTVRMVIASGKIEKCQMHAISNRIEYQGKHFNGNEAMISPAPDP